MARTGWWMGVLVAGLMSGRALGAEPELKTALARLKEETVQAYVRCDVRELDRIYSDDFTVTDAKGTVRRKADELDEARAGRCGLASGKYEPLAVREFGDLAVMSGHTTLVLREEKGERQVRYYSVNVFRREGGRWRYAAAFTP
jgi:ketosteroid isomerase-like protein